MAKRVATKRVDNDQTKGLAQPFLILAHVRTGGTFLAHALSNHPQVFCDRGETLHHLSNWRNAEIPVGQIVDTIWNMDGYHAAGFRAIYRQAFHPAVWKDIERVRPRIIHLTRENVTRQGVSYGYQQLVRQGVLPFHPVHSFEPGVPEPVKASPKAIVKFAATVRREMIQGREQMRDYPGELMEMSYEAMTKDMDLHFMLPPAADQIQSFLGVERQQLRVMVRRDFCAPMSYWFSNWRQIRAVLEAEGFGGLDG